MSGVITHCYLVSAATKKVLIQTVIAAILTTISSITDWSKVASVQTCTIGQGPLSVSLVLGRNAGVYLLVIRHRPIVANIHKPLWQAHLYRSPK